MRAGRSKTGFTMIELVAVLAIMAISLALVAPTLRNWNQGVSLTNTAEQIIAAANFARSHAIATADVHRLEFETGSGAYHVSSLQDGATVIPTGDFAVASELPTGFTLNLKSGGKTANMIEFYPIGRTTPTTIRVTSTSGDWIELGCESPAEKFHVLGRR